MKINSLIPLSLFLIIILFEASSCSPSASNRRTSRYSSAEKREKTSTSKATVNKKYAYHSKSSEKTLKPLKVDITRDEIVLSAIRYTGRDYKPGGKSPDTGFDCSGFTSFIFNQHGIPVSGSSDQQAKLGKPKSKENLLPGDLVFFGNEERISHVGIVASNKSDEMEIVHSTTSAGVKIDNISHSDYWQSRFLFGVDIISK
ncbi:MAG: C40 family peptidase [Saprospiraceae bacterium]|nr:C40 family peptidase [Saprospiraceae bacterium]